MNAIFIIFRLIVSIFTIRRHAPGAIAEIKKQSPFFNFMVIVSILFFIGIFLIVVPNPLVLVAFFLVQWAVIFRVGRLMRRKIAGQSDAFLTGATVQEVPSAKLPTFTRYTASTSTSEFAASRELIVAAAQDNFYSTLRQDFWLACAGFVISVSSFCLEAALSLVMKSPPNFGSILFITGILGVIFLLASMMIRWLFIRHQYRPQDTKFQGALVKNPFLLFGEELANFFHKGGTKVVLGLILLTGIIESVFNADWFSMVGLVVIGWILAYRIVRSRPKIKYNIKLLILRTFDMKDNTLFTFGRLIQFWENVGNYFTVVDSSYLKYKYQLFSRRSLGVLLVHQFLWLACLYIFGVISLAKISDAFGDTSVWLQTVPILCSIVVTIVLIMFEYYMISRDFIKSREQIHERIDRVAHQPRGLSNAIFRGIATMCHANTWKSTVAEMVKSADIVLMDLRGFSEQKNGCRAEINFLLDNIAVDRLLILTSAKDDHTFIQHSILEQWKDLREDSPNLTLKDPQIEIYECGAQNEMDVQGIFDQLIGMAVSSGRLETDLIPNQRLTQVGAAV